MNGCPLDGSGQALRLAIEDTRPVNTRRGLAAARIYGRFFRDPVGCIMDAHRRFGPLTVVGGVLPGRKRRRLHVLALGPQYNQQVFSQVAAYRATGQLMAGPQGSAQRRIRYGLIRMNGEVHQQQRALVMPLFQKPAVQGYVPRMVRIVDEVLDGWPTHQAVNMHEQLRRLSLRISSDILLGSDDPRRALELGDMIGRHLERNFSARVWSFPLDVPLSPYRGLLRSAERLERAVLEMAEHKRRQPGSTDLFAMLVRAHDQGECLMDHAALVGQGVILFGASYETVVNGLTWALFLLAQHPRAMAELSDELDSVLGAGPPTADQLGQLKFLDACVRESLRLIPPVPFVIRSVTTETMLGDLALRRGDRVIVSPYLTHHLPDLFPDPQAFDPGRWRTIRPGPYEYLPFGAGPRLCVGYSFAMATMQVALAMIVRRFRLRVVPGSRIDRLVRVTMGPRRGLPMSVHPQDRRFEAAAVRGNIHEMADLAR